MRAPVGWEGADLKLFDGPEAEASTPEIRRTRNSSFSK